MSAPIVTSCVRPEPSKRSFARGWKDQSSTFTSWLKPGNRAGDLLGLSLDVSREDTKGYRDNNRFVQTNVSGLMEARGMQGRAYLRMNLGWQNLQLPGALTEAQIAANPRQIGAFPGVHASLAPPVGLRAGGEPVSNAVRTRRCRHP